MTVRRGAPSYLQNVRSKIHETFVANVNYNIDRNYAYKGSFFVLWVAQCVTWVYLFLFTIYKYSLSFLKRFWCQYPGKIFQYSKVSSTSQFIIISTRVSLTYLLSFQHIICITKLLKRATWKIWLTLKRLPLFIKDS